jgi:hypothetical protein
MIRFILAALVLIACSSDPLVLPDPTTGASSSVGSGGMGGTGGHGGMGGVGGDGGSGGTGGAQVPGDGSGTRLRRKVYTSPDGLLMGVLAPFYDTTLNIECLAALAPGGGTRCMPASAYGTAFSDAARTMQAVPVNTQCGDPSPDSYVKVATTAPGGGCNQSPPPPAQWYHIGAKLPLVSAYQLTGNTCQPFAPANYSYFAIGAEVDYSTFAPVSLGWE